MVTRSRAISVEMVMVMLVLTVFALVVFSLIGAGTNAYNGILSDKDNLQSARVAYSYINMKLKHNDVSGCIAVAQTEFGDTLAITSTNGEYITYLFCSDGALYECLTAQGNPPAVEASNRITSLDSFKLEQDGSYIDITCVCENNGNLLSVEGTVGLRS